MTATFCRVVHFSLTGASCFVCVKTAAFQNCLFSQMFLTDILMYVICYNTLRELFYLIVELFKIESSISMQKVLVVLSIAVVQSKSDQLNKFYNYSFSANAYAKTGTQYDSAQQIRVKTVCQILHNKGLFIWRQLIASSINRVRKFRCVIAEKLSM